MSRIIDLNDKLNNRAYNFYCLDSHNELTFILECYGTLIYANIYNVMVTHDLSRFKQYKNVITQVKNMIPLIVEDWYNID